MTDTTVWPGDAPKDIAFATRAVLLAAAARTCKLGSCPPEQQEMLDLIQSWTDQRHAGGPAFPEFLELTKRRVVEDAENRELGNAADTIADVRAAEPGDPIGAIYQRLLELAGVAYAATPLDKPLNPELRRNVLLTEPEIRDVAVRGGVRKYENEVELMVHLRRFDLASLNLVPRVLAHELICHAGARGNVARPHPKPEVRAYFTEGFMDRAAWRLFTIWWEDGDFQTDLSLEQLSGKEFDESADRPDVFPAGRSAFEKCYAKTTEHMKRQLEGGAGTPKPVRRECEEAAIRAALRINTSRLDDTRKDRFADDARADRRAKANTFGFLAVEDLDPSPLLDDVDGHWSAE